MIPPPPPNDATDIFSISDQVLADRLQFIEEIGFGNWGSVWLCRPKPDPPSTSGAPPRPNDNKIAVKLVHRSKTSTTAARVRSLWNEMKVVRSFKHEPHPSIISFYSFIITPSYALITMAHHPRLVPVEVTERHAKEWFRSLLSGVTFLHKRGVVHNDIKPANILLSSENVPVLIDFGFAERYDTSLATAFHSNLSYGTPEYLSPERARGMPHDTRKSDVWSLGITFFEILIGRTPFEHSEGEQFSTKEDLEKYWARTLKGKWVGSWKMSEGVETLLRRMILPNADLRCTAQEAMGDGYWEMKMEEKEGKAHKKSASVAHMPSPSITNLNASEISKLLEVTTPWSPLSNASISTNSSKEKEKSRKDKSKIPVAIDKENANIASPPGLIGSNTVREKNISKRASVIACKHARSHSQPKLQVADSPKSRTAINKPSNGMPSLLAALSPIKQTQIAPTPVNTPDNSVAFAFTSTITAKENVFSSPAANASMLSIGSSAGKPTKKPLGPRQPSGSPTNSLNQKKLDAMVGEDKENVALEAPPPVPEKDKRRRSRVFGVDLTTSSRNPNAESKPIASTRGNAKKKVASSAATRDKENGGVSRTKTATKPGAISKPTTTVKATHSITTSPTFSSPGEHKQDSVRDRMREWERERARLREMSKFESETERESEAERDREREREVVRMEAEKRERAEEEKRRRVEYMMRELEAAREREREREREKEREREQERDKEIEAAERRRFNLPQIAVVTEPSTPVESALPTPLSPLMEESFESRFLDDYTRSANESSLNLLKQSIKMSIDGAVRLYKSSTALALGRSTNLNGFDVPGTGADEDDESRRSVSDRASWEDDALIREAKSSLPIVRHAVRNEQLSKENQLDRMTIWIRNVEKVVEDARQNFAASSPVVVGPLPPLPVAPLARSKSNSNNRNNLSNNNLSSSNLSRSQRSSRITRKILPANQIFVNEYESGTPVGSAAPSPLTSSFDLRSLQHSTGGLEKSLANSTLPTIPSEDERSRILPMREAMHTPSKSRARRATVVTRSPEPKPKVERPSLEVDTTGLASPSKRREKSRSQNDLGRTITPITQLEFEMERLSKPTPTITPRLSAVVDKSLFIRPETPVVNDFNDSVIMKRSLRYDDLTSSPLHVDPYPARPQSQVGPFLDSPAKRHVESVYDRFLMSTTGVKRNGRGYQSEAFGPVGHSAQPKYAKNFFNSTRKPMPPPVSSEDWKNSSTDEFGTLSPSYSPRVIPTTGKTDGVSKFRTALRTIVNGKR